MKLDDSNILFFRCPSNRKLRVAIQEVEVEVHRCFFICYLLPLPWQGRVSGVGRLATRPDISAAFQLKPIMVFFYGCHYDFFRW